MFVITKMSVQMESVTKESQHVMMAIMATVMLTDTLMMIQLFAGSM